MKVTKTPFKDLLIIKQEIIEDDRGYFYESYNKKTFQEMGIFYEFIQDNQSSSRKGVLRGLHFQRPPFAQTKLIRVIQGIIHDVVVDLRKGQPTFLKYFSIELSSENRNQLLVPGGFAHGFVVLSSQAEILYKCNKPYRPEAEGGILFNDPDLNVDWKIPMDQIILSTKDQSLPTLANAMHIF